MIYFSIFPANRGYNYQYSISNTSTNSLRQNNRKHRSQCCGYNSWYLPRLLSANFHNSVQICKATYRKKILVPEQSQQPLRARMRNEYFAKQVLLKLPAQIWPYFLPAQDKRITQIEMMKNIPIWREVDMQCFRKHSTHNERCRTAQSIPPLSYPCTPWQWCMLVHLYFIQGSTIKLCICSCLLSLTNDHWNLFPKQ